MMINTGCNTCDTDEPEVVEDDCSLNQLCSVMPVQDAFKNPNTQDGIIVARAFLEDGPCGPEPRCQVVSTSFDLLYDCIIDRLGRRLIDIQVDETQDAIIEFYSDGTQEVNSILKYLDNVDTDTDTRLANPTIGDPDNDGNQDVVWDVVDIDGNVIGTETFEILNGNTVSIVTGMAFNGATRVLTLSQQLGADVTVTIPAGPNTISNVNSLNFNPTNRVLTLTQDTGGTQTTTIPALSTPAIQYLAAPATILNVSQARASGTFDSGLVNFNVGSLTPVPAGATGVIIRAAAGINGQNVGGLGNVSELAFVHIEIASTTGQLNGGNASSVNAFPTLVSYVDADSLDSDNDDTNDVFIPLNGNNIAYRATTRFNNNLGVDTGIVRMRLVGFTF